MRKNTVGASEEGEPILGTDAVEGQENYRTFGSQSNQDPKASVSFRDALTPAVTAMCVTYGLVAYQCVFYDGK